MIHNYYLIIIFVWINTFISLERSLLIRINCVETILELAKEYKAEWIQTAIDCILCSWENLRVLTNNEPSKISLVIGLANAYNLYKTVYKLAWVCVHHGQDNLLNLKKELKVNIAMGYCTNYSQYEIVKEIIEEITEVKILKPEAPIIQFADSGDCDVVVKVGDQILHLHSAILCYCSPVFQAMLTGNFKEATTKEITLVDKEAKNVIALFGFCYCNNSQQLTGEV